MRHIPISLYIDTEVFKHQKLRLDTEDFRLLKAKSGKGGIRLLVPAIMERELLRHYRILAEECADVVTKKHPISSLEMWKSRQKNEVIEEFFNQLKTDWEDFKSHFTVEKLPLVGNLDQVVEWYFAVQPPFSPNKKKEFPDAFILSTLDSYHNAHKANIAVVSGDGDFSKACEIQPYIQHFKSLEKYIRTFEPELTKKYVIEKVDPIQPIVTEDLTKLRAILGRESDSYPDEIERVIRLLQSREENYRYFFLNAKEPMWIPHLQASGFFDTENGGFNIPDWPPIHYLERVVEAPTARDEVLSILDELPETTNPFVLEGIVNIVLKSDDSNNLVRFSEKLFAFVDHYQWGHEKIIRLVNRLSFEGGPLGRFSEAFLFNVVAPDQQTQEKHARRKADPEDLTTLPNPRRRFDEWESQEIFEKGVRPLVEREPYRGSRILIDATATMIRLTFHQDELEEVGSKDYSTIWCRRVNESSRNYQDQDSKEHLVSALTFACEKVYENVPESVSALDQALRNQRWDIFTRIRQHLYALHLTEQTKPWIRELILTHKDYAWPHQFEFQRMIRLACEKFGADLLARVERERIFKAILSGPSEQEFREFLGDQFTEELFEKRKHYFHLAQLSPFGPVLFDQYADYFQELKAEEERPVTDDYYPPYRS